MQGTFSSFKTVISCSLQHVVMPLLSEKFVLILCLCSAMFVIAAQYPCFAQTQRFNMALCQEFEQECLIEISQELHQDTLSKNQRNFIPISSLGAQNDTSQGSTRQRNSTTATMTKSPIEALWKSIIPGWGQLYVESYWKAPIFFGGAVYCVAEAIGREQLYQKNETLYKGLDTTSQIRIFPQYLRIREFYRDTRDAFIIASVAVWALAAVDAFVGAHLYDFDVSDEIPANDGKTSLLPSDIPPHILTEQRLASHRTSPPRLLPYFDLVQLRLVVVVHW